MAEEKVEGRDGAWRQLLSWTELFRGFQVALDLNKLLLAAGGILTMTFGWWLLSLLFSAGEPSVPPAWGGNYPATAEGWDLFRQDRLNWNLMHAAADLTKSDAAPPVYQVEDVAQTLDEYALFKDLNDVKATKKSDLEQAYLERVADLAKTGKIEKDAVKRYQGRARQYAVLGRLKPAGTLKVGPWFEDRGPNPYLLVTGQTGIPWEPGQFWEWFVRDQALVMIEPLVKFVRPLVYFLSPHGDTRSRFYFLTVMLWALATWSFFGGAITRIAAVQLTRGERIGLFEAMRFTGKRILSYVTAPLFPLAFVFVILVFMAIFGLVGMIPYFGDVLVWGLFWPVMLLFGLVMAVALVGLVGWPLMAATISTEGTDSWEAVSRAYSYVYQRPWHYLWYSLVAIFYGGLIVFFIGFMGSLTVYLAKWGVGRTPFIQSAGRDPSFLFVYAPTSFGWRELLLEGAKVEGKGNVVDDRGSLAGVQGPGAGGVSRWNRINDEVYTEYAKRMNWGQWLGACMVAFWMGLVFLLVLGFGYSYFWTASTIIYLLLRRNIDSAELDEVYLEEDDHEGPWGATPAPAAPAATPAAAPAAVTPRSTALPVVEAPHPAAPAPVAMPAPVPPPPPPPPPPPLEMAPEQSAPYVPPSPLRSEDGPPAGS